MASLLYGGVLLGAPIGSCHYINAWLDKKLRIHQQEHDSILNVKVGYQKQWTNVIVE